jgi:hypothetical protein
LAALALADPAVALPPAWNAVSPRLNFSNAALSLKKSTSENDWPPICAPTVPPPISLRATSAPPS